MGWRQWRDRFIGDPGWTQVFPYPPRQPDSRAVYLGGIGLVTALRGAFNLFASPPQAWIFGVLGHGFTVFWSAIWLLVGLVTVGVAATGHRHPDWDRLAAFMVLSMWSLWALLYLISGIVVPDDIADERRLNDFLQFGILSITAVVLAAGVVTNLRKTQEIRLRMFTAAQLAEREVELLTITAENERLRLENETLRGQRDV